MALTDNPTRAVRATRPCNRLGRRARNLLTQPGGTRRVGLSIPFASRGSSRFESLILSHHSRYKVTCECNEEDISDDDDASRLLSETNVESGTSHSKSGTPVILSNSGLFIAAYRYGRGP